MAYKDSLILYLKMILLCGIIYLILILIPQLCIDKRNTILISIIIVGCVYILYINKKNIINPADLVNMVFIKIIYIYILIKF